jgi:8-oxo-dGTP diphosphatase
MSPMKQVAVGILRKNGSVLVCQRKRGSRYELKWEFPGGKVEAGESFDQCLRREIREELSVEVQGIDEMEIQRSHYSDGGTFEVAYCFVNSFEGEPRNNVFEQVRWVTTEELNKLDILEGNREIVKKLSTV